MYLRTNTYYFNIYVHNGLVSFVNVEVRGCITEKDYRILQDSSFV